MSNEKIIDTITSEFERVNKEHVRMMDFFSQVNTHHEDMLTVLSKVEKEHEKMNRDLHEIKALLNTLIDKMKA